MNNETSEQLIQWLKRGQVEHSTFIGILSNGNDLLEYSISKQLANRSRK